MERGEVTNWDYIDSLFSHIFTGLQVPSLSDLTLTLLMQPCIPAKERQLYAELMFETYQPDKLLFASTSFSSLCANGAYSSLILDSGDTLTSSIIYLNGIPIEKSLFSVPFGGRDVTQELCKLLRRTGYIFESSVNLD